MKSAVLKVIIIITCIFDLVIGIIQYYQFRMIYSDKEFARGLMGIILCLGPYILIFIGGMIGYFILHKKNKK